MLNGIKIASGARWYDNVLPSTRKFTKEQVALAHISANEALLLIDDLYGQLQDQGIAVARPNDDDAFAKAVEVCVSDRELVREERRARFQAKMQRVSNKTRNVTRIPKTVVSE